MNSVDMVDFPQNSIDGSHVGSVMRDTVCKDMLITVVCIIYTVTFLK